MERLGNAFRKLEKDGALNGRLAEARALVLWDEVVGSPVRECARPLRIKAGVLYVATKSPSWSQELKALEGTIRRNLNTAIGDVVVREIRFSCRKTAPTAPPESDEERPALDAIELSTDERDFVEGVAESMVDEGLREHLKALAEKDKKLKRWRAQHGD